jgi:hypothetical protein
MTEAAMPEMTPLAQLRQRVLRFPARHEEVKRIDTLRQLEQFVFSMRDQVRTVRRKRCHIELVFPDVDLSVSGRTLQVLNTRAAALDRTLAEGPKAWERDAQTAVRELRRAVEGFASAVEQEWAAQIGAVTSKYERLTSAVRRFGMAGGTELSVALDRVRAVQDAPNDASTAQRVKDAIDSFAPKLAKLAPSPAIEDFLVAVLDGRASARSLLNEEVQRFLNDNNLWDMLRVAIT